MFEVDCLDDTLWVFAERVDRMPSAYLLERNIFLSKWHEGDNDESPLGLTSVFCLPGWGPVSLALMPLWFPTPWNIPQRRLTPSPHCMFKGSRSVWMVDTCHRFYLWDALWGCWVEHESAGQFEPLQMLPPDTSWPIVSPKLSLLPDLGLSSALLRRLQTHFLHLYEVTQLQACAPFISVSPVMLGVIM